MAAHAADTPGREFARLIKEARTAASMTQEQLAVASGVSRQTIIRYESGNAIQPRPEELRAICRALDIDPREAVIASGYVTRAEAGLPPRSPRPFHPVLVDVQAQLDNTSISQRARDALLQSVRTGLEIWLDMVRMQAIGQSGASQNGLTTSGYPGATTGPPDTAEESGPRP